MGARDVAPPPESGGLRRRLAWQWLLLGGLLAALSLAALVRGRPADRWFGDEPTWLLEADSLGRDFDRRFGPADAERLAARGVERPAGLRLVEDAGSGAPVYGGPPAYPLFLAPFVRLAPSRGPAIANALLLACAALFAARVLRRRLADSAPLLVALLVFGSVAFVYVGTALPALFLLAATVSAFALAYGWEEPAEHQLDDVYRAPGEGVGSLGRWLVVGLLLALPALHHPLYLLLFVPAALATPLERRAAGVALLVVGGLAVLLPSLLVDHAATGSWWPLGWHAVVDPGQGWQAAAHRLLPPDGRVALRNLLYLFVGRNVGLLPYFFPFLLLLDALDFGARRTALVATVGVATLLALVLAPFDFWGGPGIGNRWFLPLYGALWLVPVRPLRRGRLALAVVVAAAFLWPYWLAAGASPLDDDGLYRHAGSAVARRLPYETTQRELARAGEAMRQDLWVASLNGTVTRRRGSWQVRDGGPAELLVAAPRPLDYLYLQFDASASAELELVGGTLEQSVFRPDGRIGFDVRPPEALARHRMWWSDEPQVLYRLQFRKPEVSSPQAFTLTGVTGSERDE